MDPFTFTSEEINSSVECFSPVTAFDMSSYLVLTHSFYTNQQMKAYKSLTDYKYFEAGFVHDCKAKSIGEHIVVIAKVKHSQRMNNPPLQVWIIFEKDGAIISAHCTCMVGHSEVCSHVAAVLYGLEYINQCAKNVSCTDVKAKWLVPSISNVPMVFHICEEEKKISFLCPNGTIFQQSDLICEWWFKVNCSNSPNLYVGSVEQLRNDESRRKSYRRVISGEHKGNHGAVMRTEDVFSSSVERIRGAYNGNKKLPENNSRTRANSLNHGSPRYMYNQANDKSQRSFSHFNQNDDGTFKQSYDSLERLNEYALPPPKVRRFNDDQTGNHLNNLHENKRFKYSNISEPNTFKSRDDSTTIKTQKHSKEYHVQFPQTSTGTDSTTIIHDNRSKNNESSDLEPNSESFDFRKQVENDNFQPASDETQITQESASFAKTAVNSIRDDLARYPSGNHYPNHRKTYSDLKSPNISSSKYLNIISSVTPQYITTQPLNNGKPFLGSRVGSTVTTTKYPSESESENLTSESTENSQTHNDLQFTRVFENQFTSSTTPASKSVEFEVVTPRAPLQEGQSTNSGPNDDSTKAQEQLHHSNNRNFEPTAKTVDYATVYGSFVKNGPTTPYPINSGNSVQIRFDKNAKKVEFHLTKSITDVTPNPVSENTGIVRSENRSIVKGKSMISTPTNVLSEKRGQISIRVDDRLEGPRPNNRIQNDTTEKDSVTGEENIKSSLQTMSKMNDRIKSEPVTKSSVEIDLRNESFNTKYTDSFMTSDYHQPYTLTAPPILSVLSKNSTQQPRPFGKSHRSTSSPQAEPTTSYTYRISTASPFKLATTPDPTLPTPFVSVNPQKPESSNVMIDILKKLSIIEQDKSFETPRSGLVIPPSVGPQTLHTLAVYFENALDRIASDKAESKNEDDIDVDKGKLTQLLTEMTRYGYSQLFKEELKSDQFTTEPSGITMTADEIIDLEKQTSENIVQSPKIRELARNFTIALSSYLNDPDMFRKDLQELRPTEPPLISHHTVNYVNDKVRIVDDELLNFSDSDSKLSLPAVFSTISSPSPTWSFILATKATNDVDVENSLNPDLNTADTQSFFPGFNSLNTDSNYKQIKSQTFPQNHWTTSPSATKLWKNTFSINPAIVNDNLETTVTVVPYNDKDFTEELTPLENSQEDDVASTELKYEIKSLPKLTLNSTEVHGLLIDFMNTTNKNSNILLDILKKLNISEDEFLTKMKDIESNPLTRRLILLLISECAIEAAAKTDFGTDQKYLEQSSTHDNPIQQLVHPMLTRENEDTRALQLLNALYSIASKFNE